MIRRLLFLMLPLAVFADEAPSYLEQLVRTAEQSLAKEVPDKTAWLANRDRYRRELKEMLGLDPEPPRGDLKPVIVGTLSGEGIVVERLHFQSLPGLYVTANFYRPAAASGKLPTILCVCGHGPTYAPDGTSCGNKVSYQHHGIWFAQHGYNALVIDTVQWGEILGEHWGTYKLNRWWWVSRGYTPAGVETWAGMRALDYLATRPEVDMDKIGVTGRSGGGAYTWYLTAVDDRVKVAAPTAGITTLRDHVIGGCIEGHCDCMYMVNLYGWDFDKLAALAAPRPLLISNTDKDGIFPLGGVMRIYESTRRIYKLLDAEKNIGLQISEGPHQDTQPLNIGEFHWFERFLKGADLMAVIKEPAIPAFKPEQLRVFEEIPKDEINTRIDETFVPVAHPPVPQTREEWEKMRDGWMKVLREKVFALGKAPTLDLSMIWNFGQESSIPVDWQNELEPSGLETQPAMLGLVEDDWWRQELFIYMAKLNPSERRMIFQPVAEPYATIFTECQDVNRFMGRSFPLAGKSLNTARVDETRRLLDRLHTKGAGISLISDGEMGPVALYSSLLENGVISLNLRRLQTSHGLEPTFPAIHKYMDIPQAVAMAAERCKVRITGRREDWTWAIQTAEKMGFAANLEIVPALEVVEVKRIWDAAPHNAFTSLTKFKDEWFITFRESTSHVPGTDGAVRVLVSNDGSAWESAALLTEARVDLRDPKFSTAPDGRLMLTIGGSIYDGTSAPGAKRKRTGARSRVSFSTDGRTWGAPQPVCEENQWLWRSTLLPAGVYPRRIGEGIHPPIVFGMSYSVGSERADFKLSLWEARDGVNFSLISNPNPGRNVWPNETTLRVGPEGELLALVRNEKPGAHAIFGVSSRPYKDWSWTDTGHIIQGPDFIRLADGRMIYAGRDFVDGKPNTTVGILTATGQAMPMVVLPSGGDCSYPGLAEGPDGQLFVSYYSSHEGKTAIYFARLKLAK